MPDDSASGALGAHTCRRCLADQVDGDGVCRCCGESTCHCPDCGADGARTDTDGVPLCSCGR